MIIDKFNCCVDAGIIAVADSNFYKGELYYENEYYNKGGIIDVPHGRYQVDLLIKDCWCGKVSTSGIIDVTDGKIIVGDPCYGFKNQDRWDSILDEYDYFKINNEKVMSIDTGGDGLFMAEVKITKLT
jgi:hypothetical protein